MTNTRTSIQCVNKFQSHTVGHPLYLEGAGKSTQRHALLDVPLHTLVATFLLIVFVSSRFAQSQFGWLRHFQVRLQVDSVTALSEAL